MSAKVRVVFFAFIVARVRGFAEVGKFDCEGRKLYNASLSAYYPEYDEELAPTGAVDALGQQLKNLQVRVCARAYVSDVAGIRLRCISQDFLDGRASFVTVALDATLHVPYGTAVCIPELNEHFERRLRFEIRDSGSHLRGLKYRRADVCVRDEADSYDRAVNRFVTLVF